MSGTTLEIDPNANTPARWRRNWQRLKTLIDQGAIGGGVTSVALTAPGIFNVTGSPITTSGTLALSLANETANFVFAGPTSGGAAAPTFRALVAADLPAGAGSPLTTKGDVYTFSTTNARLAIGTNGQVLTVDSTQATGNKWATPTTGTVTSVALTMPGIFSVAGSPITTSGTLAVTLATESANTVFAGPTTGAAATPTFRSLVAADIPTGGGSPLTTKGDLYTFSTVNTRLAVGTNGQILIPDSTATTGLKWVGAPDTSLTFSTTGPQVNPATNGGLQVSSGVLVRGFRTVTSDPGSPVVGDTWYNSTVTQPKFQGPFGRETLEGLVYEALGTNANSDIVGASSTAEIQFTQSSTNIKYTVPANTLIAGEVFRFFIGIRFNTGSVTENVTLRLRLGGITGSTVFSDTANIVGPVTNQAVAIQGLLRILTVGASGASRSMALGSVAGTTSGTLMAQSFDSTGTLDLVASVQFGTSNATNACFLSQLTFERVGINP